MLKKSNKETKKKTILINYFWKIWKGGSDFFFVVGGEVFVSIYLFIIFQR